MSHRGGRLGLIIVLAYVAVALAAPVLAPYPPGAVNLVGRLAPPAIGTGNLLGTDQLGRDILSRLIYGTRTILTLAPISVLASVTLGTVLGLIGGYWFYFKLGMDSVSLPFIEEWQIGFWLVPLFVLVMVALFSSGVIDGLDGLSGGIMAIIFAAYTGIAYFQSQIDLAAFCAVVTGGILAFLWFNIPPARFYMSETGILGLTTTLTVVAFLTDSVFTLPIIALPLLITSLSVIIQLLSKKIRGRKVFLVAPLHHHFEAIGWPAYKVVMRYWVIGIICGLIGMILTLISKF